MKDHRRRSLRRPAVVNIAALSGSALTAAIAGALVIKFLEYLRQKLLAWHPETSPATQ